MRLSLIDGMRGHLLIGMMLAHLGFQENQDFLLSIHHARVIRLYDAEFFVTISGFLVGVLYAMKPAVQDRFHVFIARRLKVIYKYYLLSTIPFLFLSARNSGFSFPFQDLISSIFLQDGGAYSDILPIYFYCFLILALVFLLFRGSDIALVVASCVIYLASQVQYDTGFFGLSGDLVVFDIGAWQFLFIGCFWLGKNSARIRDFLMSLPAGLIAALALICLLGSVWLARSVEYIPLAPLPDGEKGNWARMQLHPLYLVRIVVVGSGITLLLLSTSGFLMPLRNLAVGYFSIPFLRKVGSYSIQMFTLHVFLLAIFRELAPYMSIAGSRVLAVGMIGFFIASPYLAVEAKRRFHLFDAGSV